MNHLRPNARHNRVFVLGAGASIAFNQNSLRNDELLPMILETPNDLRIKRVRSFIAHVYNHGTKLNMSRLPLIEDVLSLLDFSIAEGRVISKRYTVPKLREIRQNLVYGICTVLNNRLGRGINHLARKFIEHIGETDSIISLNYDLIVDNAAEDRHGINYGIPLRFPQRPDSDYPPSPQATRIYKPHGSLNWLFCPRCQRVYVTPGRKGVLYVFARQPAKCRICGVQFEPLLITPTFFKVYGNIYLMEIWREAERVLSQADEIIFAGFSLPDADMVLRIMLTRAVLANRLYSHEQGKRCPIRVIDYRNPPPMETTDVEARYKRLFDEVDYDWTGFAEYISRGCLTIAQEGQLKGNI